MLGKLQRHCLHLIENLHAVTVEQRTRFGQLQAPGGAVEQLTAELAFEVLHLPRQHRMGLAREGGSGTEAAVLDHPAEGLHGAELVHQRAVLLEICGPLQALA
ncbi:hypothetical protein D3C80_1677920 [compost metagenome]